MRTTDQGVPGSRPGRVAVRCGLEQDTFTPCLVLVKPRKPWTTDCDEAGDYVVSNVLSPRDKMDETVLHTHYSFHSFCRYHFAYHHRNEGVCGKF